MASPTQGTWIWVDSRSWWWTERPGMLQSIGSQRVRHDWATELNWTETKRIIDKFLETLYSLPPWFCLCVLLICSALWLCSPNSSPYLLVNCFLATIMPTFSTRFALWLTDRLTPSLAPCCLAIELNIIVWQQEQSLEPDRYVFHFWLLSLSSRQIFWETWYHQCSLIIKITCKQ